MSEAQHEVQTAFPAMRVVDLDTIERELDNMWRETNTNIAATGGHAYSRNSVLTLVAFVRGNAQARRLLTGIHRLTTQHPSRAIVVAADPEGSGQMMRAQIGTYIAPDAASYGEDIIVEAQGNAVRHTPGVVLPLIVSGLPSFLWWVGQPPWGTELLESLVDGCDRLIVDTSEMSDVVQSVTALDDLMHRKKTRCAVSDLSWAAQAPWREIVAQFFDPPQVRPYLTSVERVAIDYAAGDEDAPANASQAYLFAGWLASRLDWRIDPTQQSGSDSSRQHTLRDANGRTIMLEVNARYGIPQRSWWEQDTAADGKVTPAIRYGALMSVHIESRVSGPRATFTVARERDLVHATTRAQIPDDMSPPSQTVHLQSIGEGTVLAEQLQMLGHDAVYEVALDAMAQFLRPSTRRSYL